jgi:phage shock protein PspC (stress-responsive transcriptional regulator)
MDITMNVTDPPDPEPSRSSSPKSRDGAGGVLPPKRIYRDPNGPIGGVAGGFAGYFEIDPVIARLLWIVALFSGVGIPAYIVCWLIIPKAKVWPPPGYELSTPSSLGQSNAALLSGFVIIGLVAVIGSGVDGIGNFLLPAVLVGFGVYLLCQRGSLGAAPEASAIPPAEAPAGASVGRSWTAEDERWTALDDDVPKERSSLVTPTVLSLLAIAIGMMGALHAAGVIRLSIAGAAAGGLVIVGVGLIASLWLGRARGLVPLGLVLTSVMLAAATFSSWFDDEGPSARDKAISYLMGVQGAPNDVDTTGSAEIGNRNVTPDSLAELEPSYEVGMGNLVIDLSRIDFGDQSRDLDVEVGMGHLTIVVPARLAVDINGEVGAGEATTFGRNDNGLGVEVKHEEDAAAGAGRLSIDYEVGMGRAEVRRASL